MNRKYKIAFIASFIGFLMFFMIMFIVVPDNTESELENRKLAQLPKLSMKSLINGSYMDDIEEYVADQFVFRDSFISIKSKAEMIMQKKENNGVYVGKDDYFILQFESVDYDLLDKIITYINNFSSDFNTQVLIAPTSLSIMSDKLPPYTTDVSESEVLKYIESKLNDDIGFINVFNTLKSHSDEYIYYKTDHHWTTLGAYYAYIEYCNKIGLDGKNKNCFNIETVSGDFYGTLFSKGNFRFATADSINIFYPKESNDVTVNYVFEDVERNTLYEESYLNTKDKYGVFVDNNHALVQITTSIKNGQSIAIIKDSYAHSLVPFLTEHYENIYMFDLRLFNGSTKQYMLDNNITDVLFLYNINNFVSDRNIMKLAR